MKLSENAKEWIKDILFAVAVAAVILFFVQPTIVSGPSMENTLHDKDYIFVSRQSYRLFGREISRGDVIVFSSNLTTITGSKKLLVKRVIGLPGDVIEIKQGLVYVNGDAIDENYLRDGYTASEIEPLTVPDGQYFVMGDNRQNSMDSRSVSVGTIDRDIIIGKVVLRLFPINKFGLIK